MFHCELLVLIRSARTWVALAIGVCSVASANAILSYVNGPGAMLSITAQLFDVKYLTSTLGGPLVLVFSVLVVLLGCDCISRDRSVGIEESIHAHAVRNHELILGRTISVFVVSLCLFAICVAFLLVMQRIFRAVELTAGVSSLPSGLAYVFGDAASILLFWTAFVVLVGTLVKNRLLVACIALGFVVFHYVVAQLAPIHFSGYISGVGLLTPSMPSDLLESVGERIPTLVHRSAILLVAFGVVVMAVLCLSRRDQLKKLPVTCTAMLFVALGCFVLVGLLTRDSLREKERDTWIQVHRELAETPIADLLKVGGSIRIEPGHMLGLDLVLVLSAQEATALDELVLSFNPGMTISSLKAGPDEHTDYSFEHGLLRLMLDKPLHPGEQIEIGIRASGKPDMRFAYLDEFVDLRNQSRATGFPVLALGHVAAIFDKSYVALMPAVRWLPVPGSNFGSSNEEWVNKDYFDVDLTVSVPQGWTIAAPHREIVRQSDSDEMVAYQVAPSMSVPNFALLASDFAKYSMQLESVEAEILLHQHHSSVLSWAAKYASGIDQLTSPWLSRSEEKGLSYPYQRFSLVEIPSTLRGYSGAWPLDSQLASPGVYMFREWSLPAARFEAFWKRYAAIVIETEQMPTMIMRYFQTFLDSDAFGAGFQAHLWRNFTNHQFHATGRGASALNLIVRLLTSTVVSGSSEGLMWSYRPEFSALEVNNERLIERLRSRTAPYVTSFGYDLFAYFMDQVFEGNSKGWEALSDPLVVSGEHSDPRFEWKLLNMKSFAVASMLNSVLGSEDTGRFLAALRTKFGGSDYTLEDVSQLADELDLPLLHCIETWITQSGLPGFIIDDLEVVEGIDQEGAREYVITVLVRNDEPIPGIVTVRLQQAWSQPPYWTMFPTNISETVFVDAHSKARVTLTSQTEPEYLQIQPFLSYNRHQWDVKLPRPVRNGSLAGENSAQLALDQSDQEQSHRVVVDDLDLAFNVAKNSTASRKFRFGLLFGGGSRFQFDEDEGLPKYNVFSEDPRTWSRTNFSGAHGHYRRTSAVGIGSEDATWARFDAELDDSGTWNLQYHLPVDPRLAESHENMYMGYASTALSRAQPLGRQGTYKIRILQGGAEEAVSFDASVGTMGWNEIGSFEMAAGTVSVEVSSETDGSFVYADAVQWLLGDSNVNDSN